MAAAADEAFALGLAVTGRSAYAHRPAGHELDFYALDFGLSAATRERLDRSWALPGMNVHWIEPDVSQIAELGPALAGRKLVRYAALITATVLPSDLERVLLLDSDVTIDADLGPLWSTELGPNTIAAVRDTMIPFLRNNDYMPDGIDAAGDRWNFNAGVMLIDLHRWREQRIGERAAAVVNRHGERFWGADQQALNCVLADAWKPLGIEWNRMSHIDWIPSADCLRCFPRDEFDRARRRPRIVHYAGSVKPWHAISNEPFDDRFFQYLDDTDWAGWRPETRTLPVRLKDDALRMPRVRLAFIRRGLDLSAQEGFPRRHWWLSRFAVFARYPAAVVGLPLSRLRWSPLVRSFRRRRAGRVKAR